MLLVVVMSLILCTLYILYQFYNLTYQGLANSLIVFIVASILDLVLLRPLSIAVVSIVTTIYEAKISRGEK